MYIYCRTAHGLNLERWFHWINFHSQILQTTSALPFDSVKTVSIPTDAILCVFVLSVFAGLIYLFHELVGKGNQLSIQKTNQNLNFEVIKSTLVDQSDLELIPSLELDAVKIKPNRNSLFSSRKIFGLVSLAFLGLGGTSYLLFQSNPRFNKGLQTTHLGVYSNSNKVNTSVLLDDATLSMPPIRKAHKINYRSPLFLNLKTSNINNFIPAKTSDLGKINL